MCVVSRKWVWVESMDVVGVVVRRYNYIFPHTTYLFFFAAASLLFVHF